MDIRLAAVIAANNAAFALLIYLLPRRASLPLLALALAAAAVAALHSTTRFLWFGPLEMAAYLMAYRRRLAWALASVLVAAAVEAYVVG